VTRRSGQITPLTAALGGLVVATVATGLVAALSLLLERTVPALEAPAEAVDPMGCPDRPAGPRPVAVSASRLLECPRAYDGVSVAYEGEAVRILLPRGDRSWVHLNDDPYALALGPLPEHRTAVGGNSGMAVSIPAAVAGQVRYVGNGRHRGDVLAVTGVFLRADPADGGGPTIQAGSARIVTHGGPTPRPVSSARAISALVLVASAALAALKARQGRWAAR
jgi:hypothetical protein